MPPSGPRSRRETGRSALDSVLDPRGWVSMVEPALRAVLDWWGHGKIHRTAWSSVTEVGGALKHASLAAWTTLRDSVQARDGSSAPSSARHDGRINQIQLQEQLQRFAGVFADRMIQAAEPLASWTGPKRTRILAMRQVLLYDSGVLDIATGRFPEANLLDMLAFLSLTRAVLDEYWIPEVFGEAGGPLGDAFARSEKDLERLAENLLTPAQLEEVKILVQAWRSENPGQRRVESVRLFSFAETAGRLADEREARAHGLLSSITSATQSADQAVLLAERTLFLALRMPFLLRLQARISAQEIVDEGLAAFTQNEGALQQANDLATRSAQALSDARALVEILGPVFQPSNGEALRVERLLEKTSEVVDHSHELLRELQSVERALSSADRVADRSTTLVKEVRGLLPAGEGNPLDALLRSGLLYGSAFVSLFWGGYVVARRLSRA